MTAARQADYVPAPLPLTVEPVPGESATSFVARLADRNGISLVQVAKAAAGRIKMPIGAWTDRELQRLAVMAGRPTDHFHDMRHEKAGIPTCTHAEMFLGHPVRRLFRLLDRIRLCPTCVGERTLLREAWGLVHSVACTKHGCLLVDHCDCGRKLHLIRRGPDAFSCPCGKRFADISTRSASAGALLGSRWLMNRLGPLSMQEECGDGQPAAPPSPIDALPLADFLLLLHLVGRVASTPADSDLAIECFTTLSNPSGEVRGYTGIESCARFVEAAVEVVAGWPRNFRKLLAEVSGRNAASEPQSRFDLFATQMGQLLAIPPNGLDRHPIECLRVEIEEFCATNGVKKRRRVPARRSTVARRVAKIANVGQMAAILHANSRAELFLRLYNDVAASLEGNAGDDEHLAALLRDEMVRRWTRHGGTMSSCEASRYIGHPMNDRDMIPWVEAGVIRPLDDKGALDSRRRTNGIFAAHDVEAVRRRLSDIAKPVEGPPDGFVPHAQVARFAANTSYSKSQFLKDMFAGRIATCRIIDEPRLCDLYFDRTAAWRQSVLRRVEAIIRDDKFVVTNSVKLILDELWPHRAQKLDVRSNRQMRKTGIIRFRDVRNTGDGRDRPLYHYSIVDHLLRQHRLSGPSLAPEVDDLILAVRKARGWAGRNPTFRRRTVREVSC